MPGEREVARPPAGRETSPSEIRSSAAGDVVYFSPRRSARRSISLLRRVGAGHVPLDPLTLERPGGGPPLPWGLTPPASAPQPAAASRRAGSNSRKCGSPFHSPNTIKNLRAVATAIANKNRTLHQRRPALLSVSGSQHRVPDSRLPASRGPLPARSTATPITSTSGAPRGWPRRPTRARATGTHARQRSPTVAPRQARCNRPARSPTCVTAMAEDPGTSSSHQESQSADGKAARCSSSLA